MTAAALTDLQPVPDLPVHVGLGYYPEGASVARWDIQRWDQPDALWVGAAPVDDITCNVTTIKIARGRDAPLERFRPSTCTLELYDPDGRWSPWRTAAEADAYATVRPGIDVYVWYEDPPGTRHYRFTGIADAIEDSWAAPGVEDTHTVTFHANDYLSLLAAYDGVEQAAHGAGDLPGARLQRIVNNADYVGPTNFDAGQVALQATTLAKNALDEAGMVADTEMGILFCDRAGVLVFRDRNGLVTDPHYTTVQATFGEVAPEICYSDITLASDLAKIKNVVSIANEGGSASTVTDQTSVSLYKPRTYKRTDLINVDGAQNAIIAQRHLDFYAYADNRIDGLELDLPLLSIDQTRDVLDLGALWRIQVRRRAAGFQVIADLQIQGIEEAITPTGWHLSFRTFSAAAVFNVGRWDVDEWDEGLWGY
jgi:hypothetical protein